MLVSSDSCILGEPVIVAREDIKKKKYAWLLVQHILAIGFWAAGRFAP